MTASLSPTTFKQFRDLIEDASGISITKNKAYLIEERLRPLLEETGSRSFSELYMKARRDGSTGLNDHIVDLMTTKETRWFRDGYPFTVLRDKLLPAYAKEMRENRRAGIRIWSAGCSTGQEPYSIAMAVLKAAREHRGLDKAKVEILATDISPTCLQVARTGKYNKIAMGRGVPAEYLNRYFRRTGKTWAVTDNVRELVTFRQANLMSDLSHLGTFDIIFCRNVIIYFTKESKEELLGRLCHGLEPGGCLFLGVSESIYGCDTDLRPVKHNGGYYYCLPDES